MAKMVKKGLLAKYPFDQKSVMLEKNGCFANLYLLLFCRSRCRRRHRCLSSLIFGQAHLYTFQHALVYVCPWSNTVNADGLTGHLV